MKSILKELYNGSVYPAEHIYPSDSEYQRVNREICGIQKYFKDKLSQEDEKKFDEFADLCLYSFSIEAEDIFESGFRLATLIMTEVFTKNEIINR